MATEAKKKVFLIDDNEIDIFINQRVLEFNNFASEIINIQSAQEAIDLLNCADSEPPDAIFLDLNMPLVDGFKFLFEYSKLDAEVKNNIKIIVLTSSDNKRDKEKIAANPDVLTYVSKPLNDDKLKDIIKLIG